MSRRRKVSVLAPNPIGIAVALLGLSTAPACSGGPPAFSQPLTLGDLTVEPALLNQGRQLYGRYCASCHGADGRGDTPAARRLDPRPRDFTAGPFTYKSTPADVLPTDLDLARTIRAGVPATAMPPWPNLSAPQIHAIIQYIKALSGRWTGQRPPRQADTAELVEQRRATRVALGTAGLQRREAESCRAHVAPERALIAAKDRPGMGREPIFWGLSTVLPVRKQAASVRLARTGMGEATYAPEWPPTRHRDLPQAAVYLAEVER